MAGGDMAVPPQAALRCPEAVRIKDAVKALEILAEQLGDARESCATLRGWAEKRRVTPGGRMLTTEVVDVAINRWLGNNGKTPAAGPVFPESTAPTRPPATARGGKTGRRCKGTPSAKSEAGCQSKAAEGAGTKVKPSAATTTAASPVAPSTTCPVDATAADAIQGPAKRRKTYAEAKQERREAAARVQDLTSKRLEELLVEINGHMEEIICRSKGDNGKSLESSASVDQRAMQDFLRNFEADGAEPKDESNGKDHAEGDAERRARLAAWRAAPVDADRRELYMQLVHAVRDLDVQVPEELNAELLPHQAEGLEWLASLYANSLHGILADEMGLGKTIQTISFILYLKEQKQNFGPHLIVAPKSTLSNWKSEFARFAPGCIVHVLAAGEQEDREACLQALRRDVESNRAVALVTNYEQVYRNKPILDTGWQLVVVDEGHKLKNPDTVLHRAMAQLRCRMRLLLTGTPLQNSVKELWVLLHYLLPDLFTQLMDFKAWFARPFKGIEGLNEFEVQLAPEQEQQVIQQMHTLLSAFLLQRLKADVLVDKLPPRTDTTVRVPLSAWQRNAYSDLERSTIKLLSGDDSVTSEQVNNALMQLRKITLHPYLLQESYAPGEDLYRTSGKLEALDRILSKLLKFEHKVLIFSQFTTMLSILESYLTWRGIVHVRLCGRVAHEQRQERIQRFTSDPEVKVFLLSTRAGGLGLNLQAADTVILFDLDWNPQADKQAVARVHRVGQTREVRVIRLVTDSKIERHIEARCQEKLQMEQKVMGAGMFRQQATADQRRGALRAVVGLPSGADATKGGDARSPGSAADVPAGPVDQPTADAEDTTSPEELNRSLARSELEFAEFQRLDDALLRPRQGNESGAALLIRCGRLMGPEEVPQGFTISFDAD